MLTREQVEGAPMGQRVAVFVDGENLGSTHAARIMRIAAERGQVLLARVYGNLAKLNGWSEATHYSVVHTGSGKNATDILLALDAFDLALQGRFDTCIIASSDRDFSHLAVKLRERGLRAVGAGEAKTPAQFTTKCTEFVVLGHGSDGQRSAAKPPAAVPRDALDEWIETAVSVSGENGSITISALNSTLHTSRSFCIGQHPGKSWKGFASQRGSSYEYLPGPEPRLRLRTVRAHS
jgi:hypothetical protein